MNEDDKNENCDNSTNNHEEEEFSGLRIKNVEEINSESSDINSNSENRKRKLPSWLTGSSKNPPGSSKENTEQKRSKPNDEHNSNEITSNGVNEENGIDSTVENLDAVNANEITSNANGSLDSPDEIDNNNIEKPESNEEIPNENNSESDSDEEVKLPHPIIKNEIKEENDLDDNIQKASSSTAVHTNGDVKPLATVKQEATSSTDRESCKYGIRCYRRNLVHRQEQAHPGDTDYKRPDYPVPPLGTPDCPYGDQCYRRNPAHFRDYAHPPSTNFQKNWDNYKRKLRDRKKKNYNFDNNDSDSSSSLKDFIVDSDESEFVPDDETEELTEDFL